MKECESCKTKREEQELRITLSKLLTSAIQCKYKHDCLRLEYLETLTDHGMGLIFNIFYPSR